LALIFCALNSAFLEAIHKASSEVRLDIKKAEFSAQKNQGQPEKRIRRGRGFFFLGERYKLKIVKEGRGPLEIVTENFQLPEDSSRQAREAFVAWYKKQAEALLSRRLEHFGRLHGFAYSGFRISVRSAAWARVIPQM